MIDYFCERPEGCRPRVVKRFTASSGEQFVAEVLVTQESERSHLTAAQIYEHLNELVAYIREKSASVEPVAIDEPVGGSPWGLKGWDEIEWAKNEALQWWEYVYFRDEDEAHDHD